MLPENANVFHLGLSAPHFVIFSTRVPGYWFQNVPSVVFSACIIGTQIVALFFSVYGVFGEGKSEHMMICGRSSLFPWVNKLKKKFV